MNSKENVVKI